MGNLRGKGNHLIMMFRGGHHCAGEAHILCQTDQGIHLAAGCVHRGANKGRVVKQVVQAVVIAGYLTPGHRVGTDKSKWQILMRCHLATDLGFDPAGVRNHAVFLKQVLVLQNEGHNRLRIKVNYGNVCLGQQFLQRTGGVNGAVCQGALRHTGRAVPTQHAMCRVFLQCFCQTGTDQTQP